MTVDQIGGLVFFIAAVAVGGLGWAAARERRAQESWPTLDAIVAQSEPVVDLSGEGALYFLNLRVEAPDGPVKTRGVIAKTQADLDRLVTVYSPGAAVRVRRDPRSATLFVDGHPPGPDPGSLFGVAAGLAVIGLGAWCGIIRALMPQAGG